MARQTGVITITGKVGNVVGMKNGYGTKANSFIREYVGDAKNPQTDYQLSQRAKMLPAVLFRRQLSSVISRAWEGKRYGGVSIREFMKYALKEPWTNVPQLPKDSTLAVPGQYLVSRGSLPTIGYSIVGTVANTDISIIPQTIENTTTIGQLSTAILNNNVKFKQGDLLTFIFATTSASGTISYVSYLIESIQIDVSDTRTLSEAAPLTAKAQRASQTLSWSTSAFSAQGTNNALIVGIAAVMSREGTTPMRSTQRMTVNKSRLSDYFGEELFADIADTYRKTANTYSTDWPYEEGAGGEVGPTERYITIDLQSNSETATLLGAGEYVAGTEVTVQTTNSSSELFFQGWYEGDESVSTQATYTFIANNSRTLRAVWTQN